MCNYAGAQARQIFSDLVNQPATVKLAHTAVRVTFHRGAHTLILLASDLLTRAPSVSWWNGGRLTLQPTHDR